MFVMISIEKRNAARDKNGQFIFKNLAFVRTAELGSFTKAAEDLHYAQVLGQQNDRRS